MIDIKEPLRGKLLAICRLCKEAFSSLPPPLPLPATNTASSSSSSSSRHLISDGNSSGLGLGVDGTGSTWCGVGKGSSIPSDLGYDPNASVSVVLPWQLFIDNDNDYLFVNDNSTKAGSGLEESGQSSGIVSGGGGGGGGGGGNGGNGGGGAVPIAVAMARASVKKGSQGQGLSCQLTAGE